MKRVTGVVARILPGLVLLLACALSLPVAPPARALEEAVAETWSSEDCVACHDPDEEFKSGAIGAVEASVHDFVECLDCHPGAEQENHSEAGLIVSCSDCHGEVIEELGLSVHDRAEAGAERASGDCESCHGPTHALVSGSSSESPIHPVRVAETCGSCHADPDLAQELGIRLVQPLAAYSASVHARLVAEGENGARCTSCHGSHGILPAANPLSKVHRSNVDETCGTCHQEIAGEFLASVHGKAAFHGIQDAPVCTDCHGEHRILGIHQEDSPVYATNIPKLTCGRCHGDLRLSEKFGVAGDKVPAYADSFHGLASRSGSVTVANCASCHGIHDILPSSDPAAHTHAENLAETCGNCHPGAGTRFAIGPVHVIPNQTEHVAVLWVRRIYWLLIAVTIGGMVLHNGLDLYRKARRAGQAEAEQAGSARFSRRLERMPFVSRVAHAVLAVSFIVLAYTGFALKYPEAWWSAPLLQWESNFGLRGWVHRLAAIAMLLAGAVHLMHAALDSRARQVVRAMIPGRADLREARERLSFLVGRRREAPREPWLGYVEKLEYLAVVWGTVIMAATGFLLWFEDLTLRWLPSWVAYVATAVHFYEAVLATLAILVWHFYSVIFDPEIYPMDTAWLTGRSARARELPDWPPPRRTRRAGSPERPAPPEGDS